MLFLMGDLSMKRKNAEMQAIFQELSEKNKDLVILVAKSIKVAQDAAEAPEKATKTGMKQGGVT